MTQLVFAMFHCIHATINSPQGFKNTAETPITDFLKREQERERGEG